MSLFYFSFLSLISSNLFSSLWTNLFIFALCLMNIIKTIIKTPITNHKFNGQTRAVGIEYKLLNIWLVKILEIKLNNKIEEAPIIEPNETYLVAKCTIMKAMIPTKQIIGEYPSATPAPVATAFPPLNFKKIGNTCPNTAAIPYKIGDKRHHSKGRILNLKRNTKIKPFI